MFLSKLLRFQKIFHSSLLFYKLSPFSNYHSEITKYESSYLENWRNSNFSECLKIRLLINEIKVKNDEKLLSEDLCKLGVIYNELGNFENAKANFTNALENSKEEGENKILEADLFYNISVCEMNLGKIEDAIAWGEKSLSLKELIEKEASDLLGLDYYHLAHLYWRKGNLAKSIELFEKSIKSFENQAKSNDEEVSRENLINMGNVYEHVGNLNLEIGNFEESLKYLRLSKETYAKINGENEIMIARTDNNIGSLFLSYGDFDAAEKSLINAKRIISFNLQKENPNYPHVKVIKNTTDMLWARLEYERGFPDKAFEYMQEIEKNLINDPWEDSQLYLFFQQKGQVLNILGKFDDAIEMFEKAIEINCKNSNEVNLTNIYVFMTSIYLYGKKDFQKAHEFADKAYQNSKNLRGFEDDQCGDALKLKAYAFYRQNKIEETLQYYKRAEQIYEKFKNLRIFELEDTLTDIARILEENNKYSESIQYLNKVVALKNEIAENNQEIIKEIEEVKSKIKKLQARL